MLVTVKARWSPNLISSTILNLRTSDISVSHFTRCSVAIVRKMRWKGSFPRCNRKKSALDRVRRRNAGLRSRCFLRKEHTKQTFRCSNIEWFRKFVRRKSLPGKGDRPLPSWPVGWFSVTRQQIGYCLVPTVRYFPKWAARFEKRDQVGIAIAAAGTKVAIAAPTKLLRRRTRFVVFNHNCDYRCNEVVCHGFLSQFTALIESFSSRFDDAMVGNI